MLTSRTGRHTDVVDLVTARRQIVYYEDRILYDSRRMMAIVTAPTSLST
ncbi:hypothetical protein [Mycobacterium lepromatosis]|nr:hypothetical protein [Mycobacterium lepromatosis]